jgi:hypothetical protein
VDDPGVTFLLGTTWLAVTIWTSEHATVLAAVTLTSLGTHWGPRLVSRSFDDRSIAAEV